jgi:hypothetical protein
MINDPNPNQLSLDPIALGDVVRALFKLASIKGEWPEALIVSVIPTYIATPESQDALKRLVTPLRK